MAHSWNPPQFLTDGGSLGAQGDWVQPQQQQQPQQRPHPRQRQHPRQQPPRIQQQLPQHPASYDGGGQETYFSDAFYDDPSNYFLNELDVLRPLGAVTLAGSTSDSSPETFGNGVGLAEQSAAAAAAVRPAQNFASVFSHDPRSATDVDDLYFPPTSSGNAANNSVATPKSVDELRETDITTKRTKSSNTADSIAACWNSPLCPNHSKEGTPPNPSNCGSACAPFLFASPDDLGFNGTMDSSLLMPAPAVPTDSPQGVVEIQNRRPKRSESDACGGPSGRFFSKSIPAAVELTQQQQQQQQQQYTSVLKKESSPDPHAPEDLAADGKNKSRRRMPHNQVERKYRESLNSQLDSLRRVVPALQQLPRGCEGGDIEDLPTPSKPSKAVVLASATSYIKQMERDKKQLADENQLLRTRIKALQALVKCEDCSLMQYVMDLKLHNGPSTAAGCSG